MEAIEIFESAMKWLREHYSNYWFFTERDIVWVLQNYIISSIRDRGLPYRLLYNFEMYPEHKKRNHKEQHEIEVGEESFLPKGKSQAADLVIFNNNTNIVEVAIEFKYEPSHERKYDPRPKRKKTLPQELEPVSIWYGKFPVAFFKKSQSGTSGSVEEDTDRVNKYVTDGKARSAYAIFIDEGRRFRGSRNKPFPQSEWRDWEMTSGLFQHISVLWTFVPSVNSIPLKPFW